MRSEASSSGSSRWDSVVVDCGRRRSTCGYCKSGRRTSISHEPFRSEIFSSDSGSSLQTLLKQPPFRVAPYWGLWANSLTVDDYQDLLDRGWRRSGCFLYKPEMEKTCCPSYTIRLKADDFVPSKEQVRMSRRVQRYLDGVWDGKKQGNLLDMPSTSQGCTRTESLSSSEMVSSSNDCDKNSEEENFMNDLSKQIDNAVQLSVKNGDLPHDVKFPKGLVKKVSQAKKRRLVEGSEDLLYTSNISFQISAILRGAKSAENMNGLSLEFSPKLIAEMLANFLQGLVETSDMSIRACNGHINFYSTTKQMAPEKKNQSVTIFNKSSVHLDNKQEDKKIEETQVRKRKLEIYLKRSAFDPEEYDLYRRYQIKVHNDPPDHVSERSYKRFLVETPLKYIPPTGDNKVPPCGFGSFHQQYVIDGKLVAVGVIDILPKCLSSKYLFWDPDLAFLSLGKYSALQEIGWVKENERSCPSLQYYYLGYYIHSCSKMRYKAAYHPSELLCPLRYQWVPFSVGKPLLDRKKYVVLSDYSAQNEPPLLPQRHEEFMDDDDLGHGDANDIRVDGDQDMDDQNSDSSDELFMDPDDLTLAETEDSDVSNILIGLRGSRLRYRDLQRALSPDQSKYLEAQLCRYRNVVGRDLSERTVYSLS